MQNFLKKINYQFKNQALLEEALTHPSFAKKNKNNNYQRLEFLGDSVLGLTIAEILIKKYPHANEGELSKRQAYLISGEVLSQVAEIIGIGEVIKFSEGEKVIGGKTNKRNLENCQKFILENWQNIIDKSEETPKDPVSLLQEIVQSKSKKLPIYNIEQIAGNSHQPVFEAVVKFDDKEYHAEGFSKKEAQKNVAILAVRDLSLNNL